MEILWSNLNVFNYETIMQENLNTSLNIGETLEPLLKHFFIMSRISSSEHEACLMTI